MAKMIKVGPEQLEQAVSKFNEQMDAVEQVINNIRNRMEPLRGKSWEGKASREYLERMDNDVLPGMVRLSQALAEGASALSRIGDTMGKADEDAKSQLRINL